MATNKTLIEQSLRLLGVIARGEPGDPAEIQSAYLIYQQMIDGWNTHETLINSVTTRELHFDGIKSSFKIDTNLFGDINIVPPVLIKSVNINLSNGTLVSCDYAPLELFAGLTKNRVATPRYWYYERFYNQTPALGDIISTATGLLQFSTIPQANEIAIITSLVPLAPKYGLTIESGLPPVYEAAVRWNLAIELAPEYGKPISDVMAVKAKSSLNDIMRMNHRPMHATIDAGILPTRGGYYNVNSGP